MTTADPPRKSTDSDGLFDAQGSPWLESGERLDRATFHERYKRLSERFRAELIGGIVYVMPSAMTVRHGRASAQMTGMLCLYSASTAGTVGQTRTTTILGDETEVQPDIALLRLPEFGGQTRDGVGEDEYTYGAPELVVEIAFSSRSIDLGAKLRDYERADVLEYVVRDLRGNVIHWFALVDGRFQPLLPGEDGIVRSRAFPGLWIDPEAVLAGDNLGAIAALNCGLASPEHAEFVASLERKRAEIAAKA